MSGQGEEYTWEDLLAEATARESVARVLLRQDLLERHAELEKQLAAAVAADKADGSLDSGGDVQRLADELHAFEVDVESAKREFRFRSIGRRKWANLLAMYPPTKDQKRADPRLDHNPETFPSAAIAASIIAPALTHEQVRELEERLNSSQFDQLWVACVDANVGGTGSPKSMLAGSILRAREALSQQRSSSASPGASSSDE